MPTALTMLESSAKRSGANQWLTSHSAATNANDAPKPVSNRPSSPTDHLAGGCKKQHARGTAETSQQHETACTVAVEQQPDHDLHRRIHPEKQARQRAESGIRQVVELLDRSGGQAGLDPRHELEQKKCRSDGKRDPGRLRASRWHVARLGDRCLWCVFGHWSQSVPVGVMAEAIREASDGGQSSPPVPTAHPSQPALGHSTLASGPSIEKTGLSPSKPPSSPGHHGGTAKDHHVTFL